VVAYSNALKRDMLSVSEAVLDEHGAVSAEVAAAMATGARARLAEEWPDLRRSLLLRHENDVRCVAIRAAFDESQKKK